MKNDSQGDRKFTEGNIEKVNECITALSAVAKDHDRRCHPEMAERDGCLDVRLRIAAAVVWGLNIPPEHITKLVVSIVQEFSDQDGADVLSVLKRAGLTPNPDDLRAALDKFARSEAPLPKYPPPGRN